MDRAFTCGNVLRDFDRDEAGESPGREAILGSLDP
jgi:hypothetical protein